MLYGHPAENDSCPAECEAREYVVCEQALRLRRKRRVRLVLRGERQFGWVERLTQEQIPQVFATSLKLPETIST